MGIDRLRHNRSCKPADAKFGFAAISRVANYCHLYKDVYYRTDPLPDLYGG